MRDRKRVNPDVRGGGKELGEVERGETLIRIYYVRKKIYFKKKKEEEKMMMKKTMRKRRRRKRKAAYHQAMGSNPVRSIHLWPLPQFLPLRSCHDFSQDSRCSSQQMIP